MNDRTATADPETARPWRLSPIAIVLILVALVGAYVSAGYSRTLSSLLQEQRELNKSFGALETDDPSKVAIVAVSPSAIELPAWVDPENTWIFRAYIPANYGVSLRTNKGLIAADSPLNQGSWSGSNTSGDPDAKDIQIVISMTLVDGRWTGSVLTNYGSSKFSLPKGLAVDSLDELVLDTIVEPGQPMRTFAVDEGICFWKIRSKKPSKKMINDTKLYSGYSIYLYERSRKSAFDRWANGRSSSMADLTP
ncbi:hypothetical protein OAG71_00970 [bacterium]|nr:hypothetical protein [bacterium]